MNEAHKNVKHKLEGKAPSKTRIQTPSQKAFVLLQCAIGQHYLEDYTLRQEMNLAVEYASRMLSAAEDYSIEESKHGRVALECLLLRRCLATSLWGPGDGVLNQLRGVGHKTTAKLAMNKVRSFADILSKSSNEIEDACGRSSPFGQELKSAAKKILQSSLSLSAFIEGMDSDSSGKVLVCKLTHRDENGNEGGANQVDRGIVTYTLAVHTDRPGGSLMFRTKLCGPSSHRITCPQKFGRVYIRLVSNLVGLDESLALDGNDEIKKSSFVLTPVKSKTTASKKKKKTSSTKKRDTTQDMMRHMVRGIDDMRVPKRTTSNKKDKTKSMNLTPSSSAPKKQCTTSCTNVDSARKRYKSNWSDTIVTPSPTPIAKYPSKNSRSQVNTPTPFVNKSPALQSRAYGSTSIISQESSSMGDRRGDSWNKQKREQKVFQQRAFGSSKENPFSAFKFDPNDCERNLEQESLQVSQTNTTTSSIFPPSFQSNLTPSTIRKHGRSRVFRGGLSNARTPSKFKATTSFVGSGRRNRTAIAQIRAPSNQDLLRQKAEEQQAYAAALEQARLSRQQSSFGNYRINRGMHYSNTPRREITPRQPFIPQGDRYISPPNENMYSQAGAPSSWDNPNTNFMAEHEGYMHSLGGIENPFDSLPSQLDVDTFNDMHGYVDSTLQNYSPLEGMNSSQLQRTEHPMEPQYLEPQDAFIDYGNQYSNDPQHCSYNFQPPSEQPPMQSQTLQENQFQPPRRLPNHSSQQVAEKSFYEQAIENPEGMIITVEGKENDTNNDADFENAFF